MSWMRPSGEVRRPSGSARLVALLAWLHPAAAAAVVVQLLGWGPVTDAVAWLAALVTGAGLLALDARIAAGWRRAFTTGGVLLAGGWGLVEVAAWVGSPLAMPGNPPPAGIALAMGLAWVVVIGAAAGVAVRGGAGPVRTALLAALGVTLWAVPAGEAFTVITALHPAALSPAWAGWARPSGVMAVLATAPLVLLGWRGIRPHHPALAATRHPELLYGVHALVACVACLRYGRPTVALIGGAGMVAYLILPRWIREQHRAALLDRIATRG